MSRPCWAAYTMPGARGKAAVGPATASEGVGEKKPLASSEGVAVERPEKDSGNRFSSGAAAPLAALPSTPKPPATACQVLYQREESVSMHIPANGRYPLDLSVPRPDPDIEADRWRLRVLRVEVYGR